MKRIIPIIIAVVLVLSVCSFTYADGYSRPENFEEMEGLLKALDIIGDEYGDLNRELSRSEYLSLVVKLSGIGQFLTSEPAYPPFSDVPVESPYAALIAAAKDKRLALGYSDGSFHPDDSIKLMEAIVYLVRLTGYTDVAEASGGYPAGYYYAASNSGIVKNINIPTDETVTVETAINLMFNALNTKILGQEYITEDASSVTLTKGDALMYESFKVRKKSGIVDEVDISALVGPNDLPPYTISVDGTQIDVGFLKPNGYLGYNVNAYYREDEDLNVLVYICEQPGKNNVKKIQIADITDISGYTVSSTKGDGTTSKNRYSPSAAIIFNGAATRTPFNTSIYLDGSGNIMSGYIDLLDNNSDGSADVVFINAYDELIVGKKDLSIYTVYDENDPTKSFVLNTEVNDPYTKIYDKEGETVTLGKIKSGMSVIIQRSKADAYQGFIRAYISEDVISGKLEEYIDGNSSNAEVIINGKTYTLTPYGKQHYEPSLLGTNVEAAINVFGEITMLSKPTKSSDRVGVLKAVKQPKNLSSDTSEFYTDGIEFYIMDEQGEFSYYQPTRYLKVDNRANLFDMEKTADFKNVISILNLAATKTEARYTGDTRLNAIIKYRLNDDGKVSVIDTVLDSAGNVANKADAVADDSLCFESVTGIDPALEVGTNQDAYYGYSYKQAGQYVINRKFAVSDNTKVFLYPNREGDDDYFVSVASKIFKPGYRMEGDGFYAFYTEPDSIRADGLFIPNNGYHFFLSSSTANLAMVKKMTDVVDAEGTKKKKVYIYQNNNLNVFECDPELESEGEHPGSGNMKIKDLKPGDVIYYVTDDVRGTIGGFCVKYIAATDTVYNSNYVRGDSVSKQQFLTKAYPYLTSNDGMHYVETTDPDLVPSLYSQGIYRALLFDTISVTVLDYSKGGDNRVLPGSYENILGYKDAGAGCTELLIHASSFSYYLPKSIFVIRR